MNAQVSFDTRDWLANALTVSGKPGEKTQRMKKLLSILGAKNTTYIHARFLKGKKKRKIDKSRQMTRDEVIACAEALGVPSPFDTSEPALPPGYALYHFYGEVEAGTLQEPDMTSQIERPPIPFFCHPDYPNATPMAWVVKGDSMNIDIPDGSIAFGVDFQEAGGTLQDGKTVVVEQVMDGRIERTIKMVKIVDGDVELHPRSHKSGYRPILLKHFKKGATEIRIRSLIHNSDKALA